MSLLGHHAGRRRQPRKPLNAVLAGGLLLCGAAFAEQTPDYDQGRWDPIHFKPAIDQATNTDCLKCHQEILDHRVRPATTAGVPTAATLAWYQTLDTYSGEQDSFHRRHMVTDFAKEVMSLQCITCHQGNNPRDETANSAADSSGELIQRKHVDPNICLMCHGQYNATVMGLPPGDWSETGKAFNFDCLICHVGIRTHRHQVNYLKADAIERAAKERQDVCFGCHGGRAWYRVSFPYPRHQWLPGATGGPDWSKDRPAESEARFLIKTGSGEAVGKTAATPENAN
jgi:hypothetical protein